MGQNLALNIADHGFQISVYNRTDGKDRQVRRRQSPTRPVASSAPRPSRNLSSPSPSRARWSSSSRPAKPPTPSSTASCRCFEQGDIIIDGGNALWTDTIRREKSLREKGLRFIGSGVSGGEEGARFGPSLMPGGEFAAWKELKPIWEAIAAKVDGKTGKPIPGAQPGKPVKGRRALHDLHRRKRRGPLCEDGPQRHRVWRHADDLRSLRPDAGPPRPESRRNGRDFLRVEHRRARQFPHRDHRRHPQAEGSGLQESLRRCRPRHRRPERHGQMDLDQRPRHGRARPDDRRGRVRPLPQRHQGRARRRLEDPQRTRASKYRGSKKALIAAIHDALYCSKICSYAQGFQLMRTAQAEYGWKLNFGEIAQIFRGGCIIRAAFLQKITEAYARNPEPGEPAPRPVFQQDGEAGAGQLAQGRVARRRVRRRRRRRSARRSPTTTATARPVCRRICCRPSATTSARTPTSAPTSPAASSSTSTGPSPPARNSKREWFSTIAGVAASEICFQGAGNPRAFFMSAAKAPQSPEATKNAKRTKRVERLEKVATSVSKWSL